MDDKWIWLDSICFSKTTDLVFLHLVGDYSYVDKVFVIQYLWKRHAVVGEVTKKNALQVAAAAIAYYTT